MKYETKKKLWKVVKIIWWIIGCLILTGLVNFFILTQLTKNTGEIIYPLLFGTFIFLLIFYFMLTFMTITIRYIIREIKVNGISGKANFFGNANIKTPPQQNNLDKKSAKKLPLKKDESRKNN